MAAYAENRKAYFNYEVLDKYEAGIELLGTEVKAVRAGKMSLDSAFVVVRGGEVYLLNASVEPYQPNNLPSGYDRLRNKKLLLTKKEVRELASAEKNLTIVPLRVYNKGRKIKIEIAKVKGKKKYDKRESIKKRETNRELRREYKGR